MEDNLFWEVCIHLNSIATNYKKLCEYYKTDKDLVERSIDYFTSKQAKIYVYNYLKNILTTKGSLFFKSNVIGLDTNFPYIEASVIFSYGLHIYSINLKP